jgi:hypothetical protein
MGDPEVEKGKAAIVECVMEIMRDYSIEPEKLVFQWDEDFDRSRWNLNIYRGKQRRQLGFREQDVEDWPSDIKVAERYKAAILKAVELFLRNW